MSGIMTTMFLVEDVSSDEFPQSIAIYSTREKAEEAIVRENLDKPLGYIVDYNIEEMEVDPDRMYDLTDKGTSAV